MTSGTPTAADPYIASLGDNHVALASLVGYLGPHDLERPSGSSQWDVSQVLGHLGSGAVLARASLAAALDGSDTSGVEPEAVWSRWNAMTADERASEFVEADGALVELYESLDETARRDLRINLPFLPAPADVATVAGLRLNEVMLHRWDLEVEFDASAGLDPTAVELLIDRVPFLIGFIGKADSWKAEPLHLAVETWDPTRNIGLAIGESVALTEAPAEPTGVLRAPAESWLRLVSGRLGSEHTPESVTLHGGPASLDDLRRVFPGY